MQGNAALAEVPAGLTADQWAGKDPIAGPPYSTKNTVARVISGEKMGSSFDGWLAFYEDTKAKPTPDLIGRLCVLEIADGRVLLRKLAPGRWPGKFDLWTHHGDPMVDQEVTWASPVTWICPPEAAQLKPQDLALMRAKTKAVEK